MRIVVYTNTYNEEIVLPYWIRYYEQFAERLVIYDNFSTDRTREIAASCPIAEVRDFDTGGEIDERKYIALWNECYKECRNTGVDWVLIADADEIFYTPNLIKSVLAQKKNEGVRITYSTGYEMVSDALPTTAGQIYDEIKTGQRAGIYDKPAFFVPELEVSFGLGRHEAFYDANTKRDLATFKLLHYARLSADHMVAKCRAKTERLSQANLDNGWGWHVYRDEETIRKEHAEMLKNSYQVIRGCNQ